MEFKDIMKKAQDIRVQYTEFEISKYGREWTDEEIALGFVGDVGDLMKLIQAQNNIRDISNYREKLEHELADCLWSIIILANKYNMDLEHIFLKTMDELQNHLNSKLS